MVLVLAGVIWIFLREEKGRDVGVREGIGEEGEGIIEEGGEVGGCECVQMGRNIWIKL